MLNVVIVGGGIAGFAAAVSLRRAGHAVRIYERSALNNEVGAAIHLPPNATRCLLAWGLDPVRAKFVTCKSSFRAKGDTLEKFHVGTEDYIEGKYGAPWYLCHRVDLHEELKRLATQIGGVGYPAEVHLRSEVTAYDPQTPSITLKNGQIIKGDLVLGADGVHSLGVEPVVGRPSIPETGGHYNFCYRWLIPTKEIAADPATKFFQEDDDGRMKFLVGNGKRIVAYPCRSNEVQNFVGIFHNPHAGTMDREDWHKSVDRTALLKLYHDFHPSVRQILAKATEVKQWILLFRPPIPTWTKDKMALVGDAAHPMLPHQGQGGAQGIEDGIVVGMSLVGATPDQVAGRIKVYEKIRINRGSVMQIFSNAGQDEPERIREEASKFIPAEQVPKNPEEFFDYNFGYDVARDTIQHMTEHDPTYHLPDNFWDRQPVPGVYP